MIELIDGLYLRADDLQVILCEKKVFLEGKNAGEERFDSLGYYPDLSTALRGAHRLLVNRRIAKRKLEPLDQALKTSSRILERLEKLAGIKREGA